MPARLRLEMTFTRLPAESLSGPPTTAAEHRRKVQQAADERTALRDSELESQASPMKDPQERIGIWERLHALRLPRAPGHVLVRVIAKQTRLTVSQVHEEQQRRAGTLSPPLRLPVAHDPSAERDPVKEIEPHAKSADPAACGTAVPHEE
jgi:hypothetical protein